VLEDVFILLEPLSPSRRIFIAFHSLPLYDSPFRSFRLNDTRVLCTALGKVSYEVPERLAGLLGASPRLLGIPGPHVRSLEVPHERVD
jgi:hypothetical protein